MAKLYPHLQKTAIPVPQLGPKDVCVCFPHAARQMRESLEQLEIAWLGDTGLMVLKGAGQRFWVGMCPAKILAPCYYERRREETLEGLPWWFSG